MTCVPACAVGYIDALVCTVSVVPAANEKNGAEIAKIAAIAMTVVIIDVFFKLNFALP